MKLLATALIAASSVVALPAVSQTYPTKPIRVVVPFPAGGTDVTARIVMTRLATQLGQPVVVENRAGANGIIGSEFVARSAPDGYTLLITTPTTMVTGFLLTKDVPFDPLRDFTAIGSLYEAVQTLAVPAKLPVSSFPEFISYAKQHPGKLNYASIGNGSAYHLNGELLRRAAGIDIVHVPYKGTGPMTVALLAGEVDMAFASLSNLGSHLATGKVKVLAMLDPRRDSRLPQVPPIQDTLPSYHKAANWIALFGPAGLPAAVVSRLSGEVQKALASSEVRGGIEKAGSAVTGGTAQELAAMVKNDIESTAQLIRTLGLKPE